MYPGRMYRGGVHYPGLPCPTQPGLHRRLHYTSVTTRRLHVDARVGSEDSLGSDTLSSLGKSLLLGNSAQGCLSSAGDRARVSPSFLVKKGMCLDS